MARAYRAYTSLLFIVLNILISFVSANSSGDGPLDFNSLITDDEEVVAGSIPTHDITEKNDFDFLDNHDGDAGSVKISSPASVEIAGVGSADDSNETDAASTISASSSGIIITVIVIVLVVLSCCAWRVYLVRKKRASKQRRSLRNHALTANLLDNDKPYKELVVMERKNTDINKNVGDKSDVENGLPSTITTTVTVEEHEALSKRLSPPPTYDEYMRSSRENLDSRTESRLSDLGPTYR